MGRITPEFWRRIKEVAMEALEREDAAARDAFVDRRCGGDTLLRSEVLSLLISAAAAAPYFERPGGGAAATLFPPGTRIGAYRVVRELASGGMGSVYLAERDDPEFVQRAAIKVVRDGFANRFLLDRFRDERRILASLEHPNIARLLDGGTTDAGLPYVVMEYVEGEPIDRFCAGRGLSIRQRLAVFQQVCGAIQYAHQHLVIHRDVKAANILVTDDGTPKLLDFGIAKLLSRDSGAEFGPFTTARVMTPDSASPEQVSGRPITVATDVYALGVLLYRLLAGRGPYRAEIRSDADLVRAVCDEIPERPGIAAAAAGVRVPADVEMIVMKALRKEPERRYASAGQLSEDIARFLAGRPVLAAPDSLAYRGGKFVARHRVAMAGAAAVVLAVVAGVATTVWQARAAEQQRLRAEHEFNAVRGLARSVMGELHDAVRKLPGSTAAQEILLRRGTEYLDALSGEAAGDVGLRREIADGYIRLSRVQGTSGMPNLGDVSGTRASLTKAVAILEPIVASNRAMASDRVSLAQALTGLGRLERDVEDGARHQRRAEALVAGLTPAERAHAVPLSVIAAVWDNAAEVQIARQDYVGARGSYERVRDATEEALRVAPGSLDASRNLSLTYKQLGAVLEMLDARSDAIGLYEKALELDRRRVAADPTRAIWRLDLSFAYGAIGAALTSAGDLEGALARYEEAVALREEVVAEDPDEDFAKTALARGYERLAGIHGLMGNLAAAMDYSRKRIQVYAGRLEAHPDRDAAWKDYAAAAFGAAEACLAYAETAPGHGAKRDVALHVTAILDRLEKTQERWAREKHAGALPPSPQAMQKVRARAAALPTRS